MPAAIRTQSLTKRFGALTAVHDLSIMVEEGEIYGIVGPDGAGKTTAMRMLTSIMDPTSGEAWVAGLHTVRQAESIKDHIGYMSQKFGLYPDLTVMENIDFYADIYGVSRVERREAVERLLQFSNLAPFTKRPAGKLSGGMKQKLGLVCALVHRPKVLFLDEPTNGVDPVSRRDFWKILYQMLSEGVTIFVSTAYLDEAERCNRIALLHKGRLIAEGTPREIKRLLPGRIFAIGTPDPRGAVHLVKSRFGDESAALFGDKIHLMVKSGGDPASEITSIFTSAGQPAPDIREIEPALEDVFVSFISGSAEAADGNA